MLIDWSEEFNTWLGHPPRTAQCCVESVSRRKTWYGGSLIRMYDPDIAVRLIVWFPDDQHAVIALFAGDKARIGDAFYDTVGTRADAAIEKWKRGKP